MNRSNIRDILILKDRTIRIVSNTGQSFIYLFILILFICLFYLLLIFSPPALANKVPVFDDDDIPGDPELFSRYIGDEHGIQGHHNSCYLDATIFGLFALSDSFDEMLLKEPQTEIGQKIKHILWKGIVNPLRK